MLSYSCPQGLKRGPELDLSDRIYDGREESGYLSHGLGQLVDGQKGQDNFRLDIAGHGKGRQRAARCCYLLVLPLLPGPAFTFILLPCPRYLVQCVVVFPEPNHFILCLCFVSILAALVWPDDFNDRPAGVGRRLPIVTVWHGEFPFLVQVAEMANYFSIEPLVWLYLPDKMSNERFFIRTRNS